MMKKGGSAGAILKYGKIEMFGAEGETLADLMVHLEKLLASAGYPEADKFDVPNPEDDKDQDEEAVVEESPESLDVTEEEIITRSTPEELGVQAPWSKIMKERNDA